MPQKKTRRTLLEVAQSLHELLDGHRLLVLQIVVLRDRSRVVDEDVCVGGDAGNTGGDMSL